MGYALIPLESGEFLIKRRDPDDVVPLAEIAQAVPDVLPAAYWTRHTQPQYRLPESSPGI